MSELLERQFVALVLEHTDTWDTTTSIPDDALELIKTVVHKAGFIDSTVCFGKLKGDWRDPDGSRTGETYPINALSPFKVQSANEDKYLATGWLDCMFRRVYYGSKRQGEIPDQLVEVVREEIARSVPLEPILLTEIGDELSEYPPSTAPFSEFKYFVEHTGDSRELSSSIGVHSICNGWMDRKNASNTHDVIVCRKCYLRVPFPKTVKTYGELRAALGEKLAVGAVL